MTVVQPNAICEHARSHYCHSGKHRFAQCDKLRRSQRELCSSEWHLSCYSGTQSNHSHTALSRGTVQGMQSRRSSKPDHGQPWPAALVSAVCSERARPPMHRKRRTVLWLYNEDYEYLSAVAEHDSDSKNISMHRLVKALKAAGVKSFLKLDESFKRTQPPAGKI